MQGTDLSRQERDSRLMNEFDKFFDEAGESLESVYERFSRLMNNMEQNKVLPNKITINTKLLNSLQPEWINYVMMVRQSQQLHDVEYDPLYDYLSQNEANVNASLAKRVARNHDPLALVANTYASPSYSRNGYMKSQKKTIKNGQTRTQERKSEQKPKAKARKSQIYSQL
ncbi:hypothetical protein Tco_0732259 [Tanacetum coccineum]